MKTLLIITSIILLGITIPTTPNVERMPLSIEIMEEEGYIDDIPFDTKQIVDYSLPFKMEEEGYIDDIPFDTKQIVDSL